MRRWFRDEVDVCMWFVYTCFVRSERENRGTITISNRPKILENIYPISPPSLSKMTHYELWGGINSNPLWKIDVVFGNSSVALSGLP